MEWLALPRAVSLPRPAATCSLGVAAGLCSHPHLWARPAGHQHQILMTGELLALAWTQTCWLQAVGLEFRGRNLLLPACCYIQPGCRTQGSSVRIVCKMLHFLSRNLLSPQMMPGQAMLLEWWLKELLSLCGVAGGHPGPIPSAFSAWTVQQAKVLPRGSQQVVSGPYPAP